MKPLIRTVPAFALCVLSFGCTQPQGDPPITGPGPIGTVPQPQNTDRDGDGILNTVDRCPDQPETRNGVFDRDGCPDQPIDLYVAVKNDVDIFWAGYFNTVIFRPYFPAQMRLFSGSAFSACGPGQGPFYCGLDFTVYLDEQFMSRELTQIGDFAPVLIIAHEIGHHTQGLLGLLGQISIQKELQADCLAGAWASSAGIRGQLDTGDLQEGARSLFNASDQLGTPWFSPGAHGSAAQRIQAFNNGFARGAFFC